jgi:proteic killer suppression protein
VIGSFKGKSAEALWNGKRSKLPPEMLSRAAIKLKMLNAATSLEDLLHTPSNHLEVLSGIRNGQHSIRINNQWRLCFRWEAGTAYDVEITDYH